MRALQFRIGASNHRSGFAEPKPQLTKESLALPSTEFHTPSLLDPVAQCLAIPKIGTDVLHAR
jgi:hypothetical protein